MLFFIMLYILLCSCTFLFVSGPVRIRGVKRSPECYRFFQSVFSLPSTWTLQPVLNTVCFMMGVSAHVFSTLKGTYRKCLMKIACVVSCFMKCQSERTGIAIRSLAVLTALRTLEAMKDEQYCKSCPGFHGLRKKWKQPVAYYLTHGSTKGDMLVNFLMPATMQEQKLLPPCVTWVPATSKPWNIWVFLKKLFFRFQNQEIAALILLISSNVPTTFSESIM
jgi:hypothetical protein